EPKTTTNTSGYYEFTNLEPGYYNIMEVPQASWFQTYPGLTSGRLWGLEGRDDKTSTIAEVNLDTMTIENRFAAPYNSLVLGGGFLAAGPSTLFYCPLRFTGFNEADSLFFEIESETGIVINQGVLEMPANEVAWDCTWHNGILYVMSVVIPFPPSQLPITYLNRYNPFTKELLSRDLVIDVGCDGLASDPYEDLLLCNLFSRLSLYEIDPHTANVVDTIAQQFVIGAEMAYTNGVLYKLVWFGIRDDIHKLHREDGSLISTQKMTDHEGFDTIAGGIGVKGGHRVWIGKKDVEANFGNRLDSDGALSGTKYEDLNENGQHDTNEPGLSDWQIYIDLDGDLEFDAEEPNTVTDANGNWTIGGLTYGRYFVREVQQKGYMCTEPALGWIDIIDINSPRDIVFDDLRNLLYVSTEAGEIERFDLSTNQFLSPVSVGGSPHGMDITADHNALYVADIQLSDGNGVVHKVNLDTLSVTNLTYSVDEFEDGSYDIAIGSEGIALVTGSGITWLALYVLDTNTDTITVRPDVLGQSKVSDNIRVIRSYDRSTLWLVNNSSDGWIRVYDAPTDTFVAEKKHYDYLHNSPIALNRDGSMAAIQLYGHCRIVDPNFNMIMGLDDSRMGAVFDPASNLFYQFHLKRSTLFAVDTAVWEFSDYVSTCLNTETYTKFTRGETAVTADGRVLGITEPDHVILHRREYYTPALPGRTTGGLDFGNRTVLCGDIDGDRDIDFLDLIYLSEDWLCDEQSMKYGSDVAGIGGPDGHVDLLDYTCLAGNWGVAENIIEYDDGFETGDFSNLPWEHAGDGSWTIDSFAYFEGSYSAKSADLDRYDESILRVTTTCGEGNIYFMVKTNQNGYFRFSVDGNLMFDWGILENGSLDWSLVSIPVRAGTHVFEWSYESRDFGDRHAWIDAIRFPPEND
ncbi:MAG: YncE family protein, partial [Planctomycetota bacterium]